MRDHELTPAQRRAWEQQVAPRFGRGVRTRVAQALQTAKEGDLGSWKTLLTGFVRGEAKSLQAVFASPRRRKVVAQALGVDETQLAIWLSRARGLQVDDDPFAALVPGFEEFGPVPAHVMPLLPPIRYNAAIDRGHGPAIQAVHNASWPDALLEQLEGRSPRAGHVMWIVGPPGSGKTALLRAGASALREAGEQVSVWGRVTEPWTVLACDDVDLLEPSEREKLLAAFGDGHGGRVLLLSASTGEKLEPNMASRCVFSVVPAHIPWAQQLCERLAALALARWSLSLNLAELLAWLEDEPLALAWVPSPASLGVVIRMAADGQPLPPDLPSVLQRSMLHLARRSWLSGDEGSALILEQVGAEALATAVGRACRDGAGALTLRAVAEALVAAAAGSAGAIDGAWGKLGAPGMLAVAARLRRLGVLGGAGKDLHVASPVLFAAALGQELVRGGVDAELLSAIVLRPDWYLALLAAAQRLGDIAPLLRAMLELPPARLCQAPAAMLPVLALGVPCVEPEVLRRAHQLCLAWWLRAPPAPRQVHMTLGLAPQAPKHELARPHPYLQLAAAATHHRRILPGEWSADELDEGLPLPLSEYAALLGLAAPDGDEARDRLAIAAPWSGERIFSREFWARLPPHEYTRTLANLSLEDVQLWWRRFAAARFMETPDGARRMIGFVGDISIVSSMLQAQRGSAIWRAALLQALHDDGERARQAWTDALGLTLRRGGSANLEALQAIWQQLPAASRPEVADASIGALVAAVRAGEGYHTDTVAWLVVDVVPVAALADVWRELSSAPRYDLPWRSFLTRGIRDLEVLRWALKTLPKNAYELHETTQGQAIAELLARDDVSVLAALIRRRSPWQEAALRRLCARTDGPARQARLRLAADADVSLRHELLGTLVPDAAKSEWRAWRRLAHRVSDPVEGFALHFVADLAAGDARWPFAVAILRYVGGLLSEEPDVPACHIRWMRALPRGTRGVDPRALRRHLRETSAERVLVELASCLAFADRRGLSTDAVASALIEQPDLRAFLAGGVQTPIWLTLERAVDVGRWLDMLEGAATEQALLPARVGSLIGAPRLMQHILTRPRLVAAVAEYLCSPAIQLNPEWLGALCEQLPLDIFEPAVCRLWSLYLAITAGAGMERFVRRLDGVPADLTRTWWAGVLPRLPEGVARDAALRALFGESQ